MKRAILLLPLSPLFLLTCCNNPVVKTYTITFVNDNGDILQQSEVEEGSFPIYEGETPQKDAPSQHEYVYIGWDKKITKVIEPTTYTATYDYVFLLGSYPQSIVSDPELIQNIDLYGVDGPLDYIKYNDKNYFEFESLRDFVADDGTRVHKGDINYYEVKPIQWKILGNEENHFYTTYKLLDTGVYEMPQLSSNRVMYPNNYPYSDMHQWLNNTDEDGFMWRAFTQKEQDAISNSIIKNDKESTMDKNPIYTWDDTEAKVFCLSRQELRDKSLGFNPEDNDDKARLAATTDFARARGATIWNKNAMYWTRSPAFKDWFPDSDDYEVYNVMIGGTIIPNRCFEDGRCIRPAIKLA